MRKTLLIGLALAAGLSLHAQTPLPNSTSNAGGGSPTGAAGGDLASTYPNPTVQSIVSATGTTQTSGDNSTKPATTAFVQAAVAGSASAPSANQILSGCGVEYVSALTFTLGACSYTISGTVYSSAVTTITLTAADPTNPRIDDIVVDNSGTATKLTGTPAGSPVAPTVDASTQLLVTFVTVAANATTPTGVSSVLIYDEATEWTPSSTANINTASSNNPYRGTKDIEATNAVLNNNFTLVKPAAGTVDLAGYNTLVFYIRSKAAWPTGNGGGTAARFLSLWWQNGATQKGNQVVLRDGVFGFSSSIINAYQQISIPLSLFAANGIAVTTLKVNVSGNNGTSTIGWYIDEITLQGGQNNIILPTTLMNFQGTWSGTKAYNPNDTIVAGGIGYVALVPNTNVAVSTSSTWAPLGSQGGTTNQNIRTIGWRFDGGGTAIAGTQIACYKVAFGGTITGWYTDADVSGSVTWAIRSVAYGSFTGTAGFSGYTDVTGGGTAPVLSSAVTATFGNLTSWVTTVTAGNEYCFQITSPSTLTAVNLVLTVAAN